MTFQCVTTHTARRPHRCEYCKSTIPVGTPYLKMAGKWNGDFFSGHGHADCRELWSSLYKDWADYSEGMAWDICEVFSDSGEIGAAQDALNTRRGFYPHAVNRIEFRLRDWLNWDEEAEE